MLKHGVEDSSLKNLLSKPDIQSIMDEVHLRRVLNSYLDKDAQILNIYPPSEKLEIHLGVGKESSYLSVFDWQRGQEQAVFERQYSSSDMETTSFACVPNKVVVTSEWLMPASESISLVLWIWGYRKLPEFIDWQEYSSLT